MFSGVCCFGGLRFSQAWLELLLRLYQRRNSRQLQMQFQCLANQNHGLVTDLTDQVIQSFVTDGTNLLGLNLGILGQFAFAGFQEHLERVQAFDARGEWHDAQGGHGFVVRVARDDQCGTGLCGL